MQPINRREFIKSAAATTAIAATGVNLMAKNSIDKEADPRPNVLFLFGEQHHPGMISPADHPIVQTPNMQRLADEGVYFQNAYCPTPLCVPSRVSTLTSRFSHATGIPTNLYTDLIGDQPNLARSLQSAGYRTCHIGKTHLATGSSSPERMKRLGFDDEFCTSGKFGATSGSGKGHYARYLKSRGLFDKLKADNEARGALRATTLCDAHASVLDTEDHMDQWVSRTASDWLRDHDASKPFFLSVNWIGPHAFRDPPGMYAQMYDPAKMDPPIVDPMTLAPAQIKKRQADTLARLQNDCWRNLRAAYYGQVSLVDAGIGMMLQTLEERGMLDNTIVVFTADHGEMLCDHGMVYKTLMYEGSASVPLIMHYPKKLKQGHRPKSLASLTDLAPTLLEMTGAACLPDAHGKSLMPILAGRADDREEVFCEFKQTVMVRQGEWKYIRDPQWDVQQLFNLEEDPDEVNNLVKAAPDVAEKLGGRIEEWLRQTV